MDSNLKKIKTFPDKNVTQASLKAHLSNALGVFKQATSSLDTWLIPDKNNEAKFIVLTKAMYDVGHRLQNDLGISIKNNSQCLKPSRELFIDNLDNEQIWQQLAAFNEYFIDNYALKEIFKSPSIIRKENESKEKPLSVQVPLQSKSSRKEFVTSEKKVHFVDDNLDDKLEKIHKKVQHSDSVDFFNLNQMEQFLDEQDEREMQNGLVQNDQDRLDEDEIDYFDDFPSDDEGDFEDEDDELNGGGAMYSDFFDPPETQTNETDEVDSGGDDDDDDDSVDLDTRDYDVDEDIMDQEYGSGEDDGNDDINVKLRALAKNQESSDDDPDKSEYEKSQIKLQHRIKKAEEELLLPKNLKWQLSGETTGKVRPPNSLLEEHLQFDHVSRPAPLITDETTVNLETIIRQRIKDNVFDDVERKVKPKEQPFEFRRRIVLESEKSKVGLAEVYEQEYLKQQQQKKEQDLAITGTVTALVNAGEAEENETKKQIRKKMRFLFRKLDSLSAFHYTPRPPEPEVKIINNLPAITVEEAVPDSINEMKLLAPEEVFSTRNKKVLQAKDERNATDRKRARRLKKKKQAVKQRFVQKSVQLKSNKADKLKAMTEANEDGKSLSSSTKFFQRLQEKNEIKLAGKKSKPKINQTPDLSKKLKL